ncbi:MAG: antibiotic biosynthesis monooxygenase [Actinomycetales bacterium]|nr:antibiotic biosynthesis monooxygenase [Actinomycetales bacterium]
MTSGLPVSVVISRTPIPGREADLVAWAEGIATVAEQFPGHLGARIYPPEESDRGELVLAFSFRDAESLSAWEHSAQRRDWLRRLDGLIVGEARTHSVSGFEGIFAHAPGQPVLPPPRWKTATIIALALYPVSLLLTWLLAPRIADWNLFLRVLLTVVIIVPYMAWLGVPYLSRWLRGWLH